MEKLNQSDENECQKIGEMLIEFFHINKISGVHAASTMLGLYMALCSEIGVPYKEMKKRFNVCLDKYNQG